MAVPILPLDWEGGRLSPNPLPCASAQGQGQLVSSSTVWIWAWDQKALHIWLLYPSECLLQPTEDCSNWQGATADGCLWLQKIMNQILLWLLHPIKFNRWERKVSQSNVMALQTVSGRRQCFPDCLCDDD